MALKNTVGNKRPRGTSASSSSAPQPTQPPIDFTRFPSHIHADRFITMGKYKTWHEKVFEIDSRGPNKNILQMFVDRKWTKLLNPHTEINTDLVKEFLGNSVPERITTATDKAYTFTTFVRGNTIHFDRDTLNEYLGNPLNLPQPVDDTIPSLCEYARQNARGNWNLEQMERDILLPGRMFARKKGIIKKAFYPDMNPKASIIFKFLIHNVCPRTHTSDAPVTLIPLIWSIMQGIEVDIARIIANELKRVAINCSKGSKSALIFPGLIMGLIHDHMLEIPEPIDEDIENPIDDTFINNLMKRDERVPQLSTGHFDFAVFQTFMQEQERHNAYVRDQNNHIMNQNEALYRSHQGIHQDLNIAHLYPGNPEYPLMTAEQYQTHVQWPEDRPGPYRGAAAAEADGDSDDDEATDDDANLVVDDTSQSEEI